MGAGAAGRLTSWGRCPASSPRTPLLGSHRRREVYSAVGPRLWRHGVPRCQSSPRGLTSFPLTNSAPSALGHCRSPSESRRAARPPKRRRQGSCFPFRALPAAPQTPLAEGTGGNRTRARSSDRGDGAGIRSLPPLRAALPAAANVGFLVRVSLRYRTPAPESPCPPG